MKYRYVGNGLYFQGLPASDLDDANLSEVQKVSLEAAVVLGMYEAVNEKKAVKEIHDKPVEKN